MTSTDRYSSLLAAAVLALMLLPLHASAQEVYLSISGRDAFVDSGDTMHQYDYWIRPPAGTSPASPVRLEIFDAALGGHGDLVFDGTTRTTYELLPFTSLYRKDDQHIVSVNEYGNVLASETLHNESRFNNRWVSLFQLGEDGTQVPDEQGYILRVRTSGGNDVNTFKMRLGGDDADKWQIVALDLSFSLVGSSFSNRVFLQPLFDTLPPSGVHILGEEETEVYYIDAFGNTASAVRPWTGWESSYRGIPNAWGFMTTGANQYYNNMVIKGTDEPLPLIYDYQLLSSEDVPSPRISSIPGSLCEEGGLSLNFSGVGLDIHNAKWFVEGESYTGRRFTHAFSSYGYFPYEVAVPATGRFFPRYLLLSGSIPVHRPPHIDITGAVPYLAPGEAMDLDASETYDPEGYDIRFEWLVNGELRGAGRQFSFSSQTPRNYEVTLNVTSDGPNVECAFSEESVSVRVNSQPYAEISYEPVIARDTEMRLRAVNAQDADGDQLLFLWEDEGIVGDAEGRSVRIRHEEAGMFQATLTVDDQTGTANARYSTSVSYKVNAEPLPRFELPEIVATGQPVSLNGESSTDPDGDPLTFRWEVSDGRQLSGPVNKIDFNEPGEYTVTLQVDDGEGVENSIQTLTHTLLVNHPPVARISAPDHVNRSRIQFSAAESFDIDQGIQEYQWDFGDGNSAGGMDAAHVYEAPGTYQVTLTVDDGTGLANSITTTEHEVRINANPVAKITAPKLVAPGQPFTLDGSESFDKDGQITAFEWFINDRPAGSGSLLETILEEPGTHKIALRVRDDSGFENAYDIATSTVRVNYAPVLRWSSDPMITEPGRTTQFSAAESFDLDNENLQFTWTFEDGKVLEGETVARAFDNPGTRRFTLRADDGEGLSNSAVEKRGRIRVNHEPIIVTEGEIRTSSKHVKLDASASYDPQDNPLAFTWELPDGTVRTDPAITWTAPEAGSHWVSLIVDDGLGLDNSRVSMPVRVTVNQPPVAVVDSLIMACTGQSIIFSSALSYDPDDDLFVTHWNFDDGNESRQSNPHHSYTDPGVYQVRLTLDDGFSPDPSVAIIPVIVEGSPVARINFEEITVCANTPVVFDGTESSDPLGQIGSYDWEFGDASNARGARTRHFYSEPGTYEIVLTVTGSGTGNCPNMSQAVAKVHVVQGPTADFDLPDIVSPGTRVALDASGSEYTDNLSAVSWEVFHEGNDDAPIRQLAGMQTSLLAENPGTYRVRLTFETDSRTDCNRSVVERTFKVNAPPSISWNAPDTLARFEPFMLSAEGSLDPDGFISGYTWYLNDEVIGNGLTALLPTDRHGEHNLRLRIRDNSGVSNDYAKKETSIFINAAPEPDFELPKVVYRGETVSLSPASGRDAGGDMLRSTWLINGVETDRPVFDAMDREYRIALVQDDRRGLSNSVQRVEKTLHVRFPEPVSPEVPDIMVASHSLSIVDLGLPSSYVLLDGTREISSWSPDSAGTNIITYGWKPAGMVLEQSEVTVVVIEDLRFSRTSVEQDLEWNPANPSITLSAPEVNRDAEHRVMLTWKKNGERIAAGRTVRLPIEKGENRFTLTARDNHVAGSQPVEIPVVITTSEMASEPVSVTASE
jgi:PKD repeat protein